MKATEKKDRLRELMLAIRQELDCMAIRRGDLIAEYDRMNTEIGRIEYEEFALVKHKTQ